MKRKSVKSEKENHPKRAKKTAQNHQRKRAKSKPKQKTGFKTGEKQKKKPVNRSNPDLLKRNGQKNQNEIRKTGEITLKTIEKPLQSSFTGEKRAEPNKKSKTGEN